VLARHIVVLATCSCAAPAGSALPPPSAPQCDECTERDYEEWVGLARQLAREIERAAHAPGCSASVRAARESSSSLGASESDAPVPAQCPELEARYLESCGVRDLSTCAEQTCVELSVAYHQRGCAGQEASATWRAAFDERASASLAIARPWQELRGKAGQFAECVAKQATNDALWQNLHGYLRDVSGAASAEAANGIVRNGAAPSGLAEAMPRDSIQCKCSISDVDCGVVAWLASFGCSPWDAEGRSLRDKNGTCQCGPRDLMCTMQCARR
jgi:hypothetical protein